ncbi:lycopene cyclase family protein [Flavobacterium sp. GCM10027622]|uniref:lycopene cyclase family protein n=1 Tax=unclassified Flavobacterium TaxID=196869 RepID=UPI003614E35C
MRYDYIFSGMGLSSLMILHKMIRAGVCDGKKILVIEPETQKRNDRTWCFWEKGSGSWDFLLKKAWEEAYFMTEDVNVNCLERGFVYKMLESQSFYDFVSEEVYQNKAIQIVREKTFSFKEYESYVVVQTDKSEFEGLCFFNSVLDRKVMQPNRYPLLQQHFVGWFVQTDVPVFDDSKAFFMDFSVKQKGNTRFMYLLPVSVNEALVEYTLFSPNVLSDEEYETEIVSYLKSQGIERFTITAKEKGNIPMTSYPFWQNNSKKILHIGTAGGWTKASTGYTFRNSDVLSDRVVAQLKQGTIDFRFFKSPNRFTFYDRLFVSVLYDENALGKNLFTRMFTKVRPDKILRFLDEESSVLEDLEVIWACPKWPFIKALFKK